MPESKNHYSVGQSKADRLIEELVEFCEPRAEIRDLLREILTTSVKLGLESDNVGEMKLINSSLKEMRYALKVFCAYEETRRAVIFGSARTPESDPCYQMAMETAKRLTEVGWMTITGAGGGIMEAGNRGAGPGNSFGINISLPFEQQSNPYIQGDPKLMHFRYFFTRKLSFMKESDATILFPGGFGTLDEGYETLTLVQTGKMEPRPILMMEPEGGTYWPSWMKFAEKELLQKNLISQDDLTLFEIIHNIDEAIVYLQDYYRVFHSMRYSGKFVIIRLHQEPPPDMVRQWSRDFQDIITEGEMETGASRPEENGEFPDLPRLFFKFNNKTFARLHLLIIRINRDLKTTST